MGGGASEASKLMTHSTVLLLAFLSAKSMILAYYFDLFSLELPDKRIIRRQDAGSRANSTSTVGAEAAVAAVGAFGASGFHAG